MNKEDLKREIVRLIYAEALPLSGATAGKALAEVALAFENDIADTVYADIITELHAEHAVELSQKTATVVPLFIWQHPNLPIYTNSWQVLYGRGDNNDRMFEATDLYHALSIANQVAKPGDNVVIHAAFTGSKES